MIRDNMDTMEQNWDQQVILKLPVQIIHQIKKVYFTYQSGLSC